VSTATKAEPVRVAGANAHEGPVYVPGEHALYFTTLPEPAPERPLVDIKRLSLDTGEISVVRADANVANGMALATDGRLVVCEQHPAAIRLVDRATGRAETLVDSWRGLRLNSPNDVITKSDGTIWFTDPSYGHLQGFRPAPEVGDFVYRYEPATGRLSVVADSFDKPNGIAFSPDESILYVTDSGANQEPGSYYVDRPHHVVAFDVIDGRHLGPARLFAVTTPGFPDGLKVDSTGRVYVSAASGVLVFDPGGDLLDEIELFGSVNFTFGGPDGDVLYVTTDDAVWAVQLDERPLLRPDVEVSNQNAGRDAPRR
jgi:gluconolactonase